MAVLKKPKKGMPYRVLVCDEMGCECDDFKIEHDDDLGFIAVVCCACGNPIELSEIVELSNLP